MADQPQTAAVSLLEEAGAVAQSAARVRSLAIDIDRRRGGLESRLAPCTTRHTADVWSSQAAESSRARLVRSAGHAINEARNALLATRVALERRAAQLDDQVRILRAEAASSAPEQDNSRSIS